MNYNIKDMEYETDCTSITQTVWDKLMTGAVRANKKKINALIKKLLPDLYKTLCLEYYNPYKYEKTRTHLIVRHSAIEYFIRYN